MLSHRFPRSMVFALCAGALMSACASSPPQTNHSFHAYGLQEALDLPELGERADLVVVGVARGETKRRFTDNRHVPVEHRSEPGYARSTFFAREITVEAVVKGDHEGPALHVARLATLDLGDGSAMTAEHDESFLLEEGVRYVLFLQRGSGIWTGHWLVLGAQGVGELHGDTVIFRDGKKIGLDELRHTLGA